MEKVKIHEKPGKGAAKWDAQVRGRQKIGERRENRTYKYKVRHHANPKIKAKEKVEQEKKRKGHKAKWKRWRNQSA